MYFLNEVRFQSSLVLNEYVQQLLWLIYSCCSSSWLYYTAYILFYISLFSMILDTLCCASQLSCCWFVFLTLSVSDCSYPTLYTYTYVHLYTYMYMFNRVVVTIFQLRMNFNEHIYVICYLGKYNSQCFEQFYFHLPSSIFYLFFKHFRNLKTEQCCCFYGADKFKHRRLSFRNFWHVPQMSKIGDFELAFQSFLSQGDIDTLKRHTNTHTHGNKVR